MPRAIVLYDACVLYPIKSLNAYGIDVQHPDTFLAQLIHLEPDTVCSAIKKLRSSLKNPPMNVHQYLAILKKQSIPKTIKKLQMLSSLL